MKKLDRENVRWKVCNVSIFPTVAHKRFSMKQTILYYIFVLIYTSSEGGAKRNNKIAAYWLSSTHTQTSECSVSLVHLCSDAAIYLTNGDKQMYFHSVFPQRQSWFYTRLERSSNSADFLTSIHPANREACMKWPCLPNRRFSGSYKYFQYTYCQWNSISTGPPNSASGTVYI